MIKKNITRQYHYTPRWLERDIQDAKTTIEAIFNTPMLDKLTKQEKLEVIEFVCEKYDIEAMDLHTSNYTKVCHPN